MLSFNPDSHTRQTGPEVARIQSIVERLHNTLRHDQVVQETTDRLRAFLKVDRVVLYYFYKQWEGRVTFESLSNSQFSILGMTGPDQCFSKEYASLYLDGRVSATANIETADIEPCHRDFLREIRVRANLVVPILPGDGEEKTLWGLLVAHHCQGVRPWLAQDIEQMQAGAEALAKASSIRSS
ncbi:MAG: GAF domain-containing protein [Cyanobacteria bacterium J06621_11]